MKRAIKIFVPIVMVVAILLSIGWYFLKYDPGLTQDILIDLARQCEKAGNLEMATWFYEKAYLQSGNNDAVAIELAEKFKAAGNYTKAEYTLSNAIADGGNIELYIALCKTYVEQDKLLDAVTMLDNVTDPAIKAQLEDLRPKAPSADPAPGTYHEYVSITFQGEGQIYFTCDGEYPTIQNAPYSAPVQLTEGETLIHAVSLSKNGLVSPLFMADYTLEYIIKDTSLSDPAMDRAVRELLHVSADYQLTTDQFWSITSFVVPSDAQSLEDLALFPHLTSLAISSAQIRDLSPIIGLTRLTELVIDDTVLSADDIAAIAQLPELTTLCLTGCSISTIADLASCTKLTYLDLSGNMIGNLDALKKMPALTYLDLSNNAVTSLTAIGGLKELTDLYLSGNSITDPAALAGCTALSTLDLSKNSLSTVYGLEQLPGLRSLILSENHLMDVSALAANTTLMELDISHNDLTDISALSALEQLFSLTFAHNQIHALPKFTENCTLVMIDGSHNLLTSLKELRVLDNVVQIDMDYNEEVSNVAMLADCDALEEVSVYGTAVKDVSALRDKGIKVTYSQV